MRRLGQTCLLAFFCALASGCWQGVTREVVAIVLSVRGETGYGIEGQSEFYPITSQTNPGAGRILRTFDGAQVDLALLPGALVRLSGNSEIKIEELSLTKDGNETGEGIGKRVVRMQLNRGKIIALFQQSDESGARFAIGAGQVTISGDQKCLFQIQVEDTKTRLTCVRGNVSISQANYETVMEPGYFQEWPSDRSSAISAADDAHGQIDITDTLEAERELQALQSKQQLRHPF